ncbi:hypothetical protein [uncultured Chitinophaga sp.]|uniref:hypothetical protein n=1 Tax=uncultured Chitinophaga sp. TaxID=339340 RepID=UPI0025E255D2|nr:hypothetical protein [uncultured Chitinophaga sp.]
MKIINLMLTILLILGSNTVQAQFLKKLKEKVNATMDRKINGTIDKAISKTTDKVVDSTTHKIEKVTKDISKRKKQNKTIPETEEPIVRDSTARREHK